MSFKFQSLHFFYVHHIFLYNDKFHKRAGSLAMNQISNFHTYKCRSNTVNYPVINVKATLILPYYLHGLFMMNEISTVSIQGAPKKAEFLFGILILKGISQ